MIIIIATVSLSIGYKYIMYKKLSYGRDNVTLRCSRLYKVTDVGTN